MSRFTKNQQLAAGLQSYLTSYRYTCLPQARSASKITLLTGKDQSRIKNRKKVDTFLIPVLNVLQVQKAISYHLEKLIQLEVPETIAAFIDVPILCEAFLPPPEYWPMVRSICDKYGILLILDCVQSGFGRFGKMFACEHYNIVPDIMVVAKAFSCGYAPLGAAIVKREVAQKFEGGPKEILKHSLTFQGSPVASAVALASLEIFEKEKLVEASETLENIYSSSFSRFISM